LFQSEKERRHALVGPAELWQEKRDFQLRFLTEKDLRPEHYLLDIGCGTLRGGIPLIDYLQAGHYYGIEVREEALAEGRKELTEEGLENKRPALLQFDEISQLKIDRKFDYMWAFSVFIHMSDDILANTLAFVSRQLAESGVLYANVNIGDRKQRHWQGFPTVTRPFEFYREAGEKHGLRIADIGSLMELGHVASKSPASKRMIRITQSPSP
jgi:cyclopropane fatty-acyl-phospholipid synthase-like methyltransferase